MKYLLVNGLFSHPLAGSQHEMRWHFLKKLELQAFECGAELVLINESLKHLNTSNAILLTSMASKKPILVANPKNTNSQHVDSMKVLGCFEQPVGLGWDSDALVLLHNDEVTEENKEICYVDVNKYIPNVFREDGLHTLLVDVENKEYTSHILELAALDVTLMPITEKPSEVSSELLSLERESLFSSLLKKNQDMLKDNIIKDDADEITTAIDSLQESGEFSLGTGDYLKGLLQDSLTIDNL